MYVNYQSIFHKVHEQIMNNLHLSLLMIFLIGSKFLYSEDCDTPSIDVVVLTQQEAESHENEFLQYYYKIDEGHLKTFLFLRNFPVNQDITCSFKRHILKKQTTSSFSMKDKGNCICHSSRGFLPGERVTYSFTIGKNGLKKEVSFIANPIIVKSQVDQSYIEAELVSLKPAIYQFKFIGFKDNEVMKCISISGSEEIKDSFKISDFMLLVSPDIKGKISGISKTIFIRDSGEKFLISLPWGSDLIIYAKGNKIYNPNWALIFKKAEDNGTSFLD
jgi:hypothetical protein